MARTSGWDTLVVWAVLPLVLVMALSVPLLTAATVAGVVLGAVGPRVGRRIRALIVIIASLDRFRRAKRLFHAVTYRDL